MVNVIPEFAEGGYPGSHRNENIFIGSGYPGFNPGSRDDIFHLTLNTKRIIYAYNIFWYW